MTLRRRGVERYWDVRLLSGEPPRNWGCRDELDFHALISGPGGVAWILRLVQTGAEGEDPGTDLMEISRPDGLGDIAKLGLTLSEAKQLLANVQRKIAAAQARDHIVRRLDCPRCDGVCHVKETIRISGVPEREPE